MLDQKNTAKFAVTLKALREKGACYSHYNKLVRVLQGKPFTEEDQIRKSYLTYEHNEPISLLRILESSGFDDAIWAFQYVPESEKATRLFAVACGRKVQHLMRDNRSIIALDVAERFAHGDATEEELSIARAAALEAAVWNADYGDADLAAYAAAWAAHDVTRNVAQDAFYNASAAALSAAYKATGTVHETAYKIVYNAVRIEQTELFTAMCNGVAPWQVKQ